MDDYEKLDKELENNSKRNKKLILEFKKSLEDKKLTDKVIKKHISNVELYINDFLNYYCYE